MRREEIDAILARGGVRKEKKTDLSWRVLTILNP